MRSREVDHTLAMEPTPMRRAVWVSARPRLSASARVVPRRFCALLPRRRDSRDTSSEPTRECRGAGWTIRSTRRARGEHHGTAERRADEWPAAYEDEDDQNGRAFLRVGLGCSLSRDFFLPCAPGSAVHI